MSDTPHLCAGGFVSGVDANGFVVTSVIDADVSNVTVDKLHEWLTEMKAIGCGGSTVNIAEGLRRPLTGLLLKEDSVLLDGVEL